MVLLLDDIQSFKRDFHFSLVPEREIEICVHIKYSPSTAYLPWDGFLPFVSSLRIFEGRNEDFVVDLPFGASMQCGGLQSLDILATSASIDDPIESPKTSNMTSFKIPGRRSISEA